MAERLIGFRVTDDVTGQILDISKTVTFEPFPVVSAFSATTDGETAVDWAATVNRKGTLYVRVFADGATPTVAAIKAGTGAIAGGSVAVTSTGAKTGNITGLTEGTSYELFAVMVSDSDTPDDSASVTDGFTTDSASSGVSYDGYDYIAASVSTTSTGTSSNTVDVVDTPTDGMVIGMSLARTFSATQSLGSTIFKETDSGGTSYIDVGEGADGSVKNNVIWRAYPALTGSTEIYYDYGPQSATTHWIAAIKLSGADQDTANINRVEGIGDNSNDVDCAITGVTAGSILLIGASIEGDRTSDNLVVSDSVDTVDELYTGKDGSNEQTRWLGKISNATAGDHTINISFDTSSDVAISVIEILAA